MIPGDVIQYYKITRTEHDGNSEPWQRDRPRKSRVNISLDFNEENLTETHCCYDVLRSICKNSPPQ